MKKYKLVFLSTLSALVLTLKDLAAQTAHTCGADSVHNSTITYGSLTDQDGNQYKTIVVGTQEWMAENLKARRFRNGALISMVTNPTTWAGLTFAATTWYNNDSVTYKCPYGKLYNWNAVTDTRRICPVGWHVPTHNEWLVLEEALGGGEVAGGKMKSTGKQFYNNPNQDATNESGFSGLPGGCRNFNGTFGFVRNEGYWWTSTISPFVTGTAILHALIYDIGGAIWTNFDIHCGLAVRCVNNQATTSLPQTIKSGFPLISPNPARDYLDISYYAMPGNSTYSMYDNMGRKVLSGSITSNSTTIGLSGLSAGIYLLQIGGTVTQTFKLIKE